MDINPLLILDCTKEIKHDNLTFLQGDTNHIKENLHQSFPSRSTSSVVGY